MGESDCVSTDLSTVAEGMFTEFEDSDDETELDSDMDAECQSTPNCLLTNADPVCQRLNNLIANGKIQKNKIFYKYLDDVSQSLTNVNHQYDDDVVDFYTTVKYLGGNRTVEFLRGPMYYGTGSGGNKSSLDVAMNLGGPSRLIRQKHASGYTTKCGVVKHWLCTFLQMANGDTAGVNHYGVVLHVQCMVLLSRMMAPH